jgi:hypothetical protein
VLVSNKLDFNPAVFSPSCFGFIGGNGIFRPQSKRLDPVRPNPFAYEKGFYCVGSEFGDTDVVTVASRRIGEPFDVDAVTEIVKQIVGDLIKRFERLVGELVGIVFEID